MANGKLREMVGAIFGGAVEPFSGRSELWGKHNKRLQTLLSLPDAINVINTRWGVDVPSDRERPIFILSAGWRSGSTLLQRLFVSGGDVLIWGEPYSLSDFVGRLAESLRIFSAAFPPPEYFLNFHEGTSVAAIQERWIAHLYPDPQDLRDAHRAFLTTLLAAPAVRRGYKRWGFKDCKYGIDHAIYLKWLFPNAKFFFVYRNPYHAYRSFRLFGAYTRWPDGAVFTAREFGKLWKSLIEGFLAGHASVDGTLVRYEDLIAGRISIEELGASAGVTCDYSILGERINGRGQRELVPIPRLEASMLARAVGPLASKLGYEIEERDKDTT